jgi:uncharacterized tellurite resistance protein B-like protein
MIRQPAEEQFVLRELTREERLLLLRFVCSFAWADLKIQPQEREFVSELIRRLDLNVEERREVEAWLDDPPLPESVDPALVPRDHRLRFLRAIESVIAVDGEITPTEREGLIVFAQLIR